MRNRGKTCTAGQNLAIRMGFTEEELAIVAGAHSFPQPTGTNSGAPGAYIETERPEDGTASGSSPMNSPFTLGEMLSAIHEAKAGGTPGQDGISNTALRNLLEDRTGNMSSWTG
ncbi:hypothetical protein IscW_ISCW011464 [Ixodes scapularis]|uniref:Uncharacterized protein n=1 Tax=Ixodes scapularis TaxID=6945 RepID=B7Q6I1_IXOSC|nr:hypothetical protein IscW_ISCW011464 [Ixodes scapularis]|eukprot:XP_002411968.1 hypothetical protein IscW_ISCW011464 [Ixodes scapularis]